MWMRVLVIAGVVAAIAGIVIIAVNVPQPKTFGWFAYAPLSGEVFSPEGGTFVPTPWLLGGALVALGLVAIAFWGGYALARRRIRAS
jgi:heme/copper-type cytochrome/quinol oxidase subunit 1